ncbi:transposase [Streptosporangium roseum]|uniref:transposase n=1 Tax=Streptosporangium roseum TaxID=2001 RepID=UPI003D9EEA9B
MTDAEWALIEPYLPVAATGPLPRRVRDQFNGILWRFRTGSGRRDVPERHGPWSTLYSRFKSDQRANRKKKGSAGGRPVGFDPERYRQPNTVRAAASCGSACLASSRAAFSVSS